VIGIFTSDEIEKLKSILNWILPVGDREMPEAELILKDINLVNPLHSKFVELSKVICNKIDLSQIQSEADLIQFKKSNFRDFSVLVNMVLILYYSNIDVLSKLDVGSVPPFPDGNFVKEGDIYLLEQVFLKEKIYID
jgi:hypothetical protein